MKTAKKILVIEDSFTVLNILKDIFEKAGFDVVIAKSGEEGVKKVQAENPNIVIIDTVLPGIDGFQTCKKIKKIKKVSTLKIIIMTGKVDAVNAVKAWEVGADDYCAKTSDLSLLVEAAKKFI